MEWNAILRQGLACFGVFLAYVIPCLLLLLPVRLLTRVPGFIFRKLLHTVAFTFAALMILTAESWQAVSMACLFAIKLIWPLLTLLERRSWYAGLFVQKRPREVRRSMVMLFGVVAAITPAAWGLFGRREAAAAAIVMWGAGDAAAALIGIPFGRHKTHLKRADENKSWEGSAAMLAASFLSGLSALLLSHKMAAPRAILSAGFAALAGTAAELLSPGEWDTLTVPAVVAGALLLAGAIR